MSRLTGGGIGFTRLSGVYVAVLFIIVYSIWLPNTFPTSTTAETVAGNEAITGIAALGLVCALSVGAFDLSVASVIGVSSTVGAALMVRSGMSPTLTIVVVLAMGLAVGVVNGLLVVRFGITSVVATLGMSSVLQALDDKITDGQFITPVPGSFARLTSGSVAGIPTSFVVLLALAVLSWWVLEHTPLGRRMIATGAGPDAARLAGTNTGGMQVVGLVLSSTLGSLAGLMLLANVGSAAPDAGPPYLLPLFAAVYLGATQIKPGRFNIWGTVVALYVLAIGVKGLQLAGGQFWVSSLFNGAALILAVGVAVSAQQRRRSISDRLRRRRGPSDANASTSVRERSGAAA
jgi:ribose transport system permease protein